MIFLLFFLLLIAVILLVTGAYIVQQQNKVIIERLGKFHTVADPGFHVKIPIIDRIAAKVNMRTNQANFEINAKTKDNVTVTMDIAAQYHVIDDHGGNIQDCGVYRSYYKLSDPVMQMKSYLIDALRSSIPNYTLDEVFAKKDEIALEVNQTVSNMMAEYGFNVVSTLITNIGLPHDVEQSMNLINSSLRKKEAAQAEAEAERIKVVVKAEAEAEAMKQTGIGIAEQRKAIAEGAMESVEMLQKAGMSVEQANQLFMFTQYCETLEKASNSTSSTVILPSDFSQSSSMFSQMLAASKASGAIAPMIPVANEPKRRSFCPQCGTLLAKDATSCSNCGTKF